MRLVLPLSWLLIVFGRRCGVRRGVRCGLLLAVGLAAMIDGSVTAADVAGRVLDADGRPVAGAAVVVCETAGGVPLAPDGATSLAAVVVGGGRPRILHAVTDAQGGFAFDDVAPGLYRVIAQTWHDAGADGGEGAIRVPTGGPLEVHGDTIELRGIAERVEVPSMRAVILELRPVGRGAVRIEMPGFGNDDTLLVASTHPLAGDPILGLAAWSGGFMRGMLAGNRMPGGRTTIRGLPAGTVHLALFAADNEPGFGTTAVAVRDGVTVDAAIDVVAVWSDARHEPPPGLAALVAEQRAIGRTEAMAPIGVQLPRLASIVARGARKGYPVLWAELAPFLDRPLDVGEDRDMTAGEWLAAAMYVRLQDRVRRRADAARAARGEAPEAAPEVTYETTLRDLHGALADAYPGFELKGIDWDAVGRELLPRAAGIVDDDSFGFLCREMVARLEDSHARLLDGTATVPVPPYARWGVGLVCLEDDRGEPVVYSVDPASPAGIAGIRPGTTIVSVNGQPAAELVEGAMRALARYHGYSSARALRYDAMRQFDRQYSRGRVVDFEVREADGVERGYRLWATESRRYAPRLPAPIPGIGDSIDVSWTRLDDGLGYIYVRRIKPNLVASLDRAVAELADVPGLIIDVRGNSGGGFDRDEAHLNFDPGRVGEAPRRPRYHGPIAVLIDARCISAGEGWASWFMATGRARFFGQTTTGASSRKTVYTLSNGLYKVLHPVKLYRGFLDRPIERRGLEPDVPVMPNAADLAAGRDTALEAARTSLRKR